MLSIAALFLLAVGGVLEVAGVAFWGLDLCVGGCFVASMVLAALSALRSKREPWGILAFGIAALAFGLHICLNFGWLT